MATSIINNLFTGNSATNERTPTMTDKERDEIVSLLQSSIQYIQKGSCDLVIYQAMGALHQYTATCAGISSASNPVVDANQNEQQRPAFVLQDNKRNQNATDNNRDALAYGWLEELSSNNNDNEVIWNPVLALLVQRDPDDEPCLWITKEILSSNNDRFDEKKDRDSSLEDNIAATELETLHSIPIKRKLRSCRYQNFYGYHRLVLELKAPYSCSQIVLQCPTARVAQSWVEFLLDTKKKASEIGANRETIEMVYSSLSMMPSVSTEAEDKDDDQSERDQRRRRTPSTQINIDVIDDSGDDDDDYGIDDQNGHPGLNKTLAEQLQEAEDRKRAQQIAEREERKLRLQLQKKERFELQEAERNKEEERERQLKEALVQEERNKCAIEERQREREQQLKIARQQEEREAEGRKREEELQRERLAKIEKGVEKIVQIETQKLEERKQEGNNKDPKAPPKPKGPLTAAEKQKLRMERELAARERAEAERKRIELEYEQAKKDRVERRRRELEEQRKLAREEQRKKELKEKRKFLESERRKEAMKAAAMKSASQKASSGVFTSASKTSSKVATSAVEDKGEKGNLWFSLDKQMSAFEVADEERKRREAEKRKEEEEKAQKEVDDEDPEQVRKRIAEDARQRLVQDEAEKLVKENEALRKKAEEATLAAFRQQQELQQKAWAAGHQPQPQSTNPIPATSPTTQSYQQRHRPNSPTSSHHSRHHRQSHSSGSSSIPPGSTSHHTHSNSWHHMNQPQFSHQQTPFQQQQQTGIPGNISPHPIVTTPVYQPQQQPAGSFGNVIPPHQPYLRHANHKQNPQMHTSQTTSAPHPTRKHSPSPKQRPQAQPQEPSITQPPLQQQKSQQQPQDHEELSESALKRSVLLKWGLQPPAMQVLKPVDQLLCSIHTVFPPAFGMAGHDYFAGWKSISPADLISSNASLDETKLKKTVRKIRFFLHPDKLPHDLTEEQQFFCKLLWDVVNDAFEEHKKSKDDLDWM